MVSPAPSTSQKPPVLSYADRAKKARNLNPPNAPTVRAVPPSAAPPPSTSSLPNASGSPSPAPQQLSSEKPTAVSPQNVNHTSSQVSPSMTPSTKAHHSSQDSAQESRTSTQPPAPEQVAKIVPTAPVANVWKARKEQMAQARASSSDYPSNNSVVRPSWTEENDHSLSHDHQPSTPNGGPVPYPNSSLRPPVNGNRIENHHILKGAAVTSSSRSLVPPPVEDTTSWPTVGMSLAAPSPRAASSESSATVEGGSKGDEQRVEGGEKSDRNGSVLKKGMCSVRCCVSLYVSKMIATETWFSRVGWCDVSNLLLHR